jgi:uncharacterized protein YdaT
MPWTPEEFRAKKEGMTLAQAKRAAAHANRLLRQGKGEGSAIAIALHILNQSRKH